MLFGTPLASRKWQSLGRKLMVVIVVVGACGFLVW